MAKDNGYNESKTRKLCGKKTAEDQPGTKRTGNKLPSKEGRRRERRRFEKFVVVL